MRASDLNIATTTTYIGADDATSPVTVEGASALSTTVPDASDVFSVVADNAADCTVAAVAGSSVTNVAGSGSTWTMDVLVPTQGTYRLCVTVRGANTGEFVGTAATATLHVASVTADTAVPAYVPVTTSYAVTFTLSGFELDGVSGGASGEGLALDAAVVTGTASSACDGTALAAAGVIGASELTVTSLGASSVQVVIAAGAGNALAVDDNVVCVQLRAGARFYSAGKLQGGASLMWEWVGCGVCDGSCVCVCVL